MRKETVPVDMSSEQKTILGIVSKRQLMYVLGGGGLLYTYVPFVWKFFAPIHVLLAVVFSILSALPIIAIVIPFAFFYKAKHHMFYDYYIYLRFKKRKQYGMWRKGHALTGAAKERLK